MNRTFALVIALAAWFAVIAQFVLMLNNRTAGLGETVLRFFSFFTILTNTLVALYYTARMASPATTGGFWGKASLHTAVALYITLVGGVYQVALRQVWQPTGLQWVVDELLHTLVPLLVLLHWWAFAAHDKARWSWIPAFLIYPAVYLGGVLLRGGVSGFYPYPFIHVTDLGWPATLRNAAVLVAVVCGLAVLFIALQRWRAMDYRKIS
jgi:hypothetical protein